MSRLGWRRGRGEMGGDNKIHRFIWLPRRWKPILSSASTITRNLHSRAPFANNSEITQRSDGCSDERCSKKKVPWLSAIALALLRLMFSNLHNCKVCFSPVRGAHFRCCVVCKLVWLWTWSRDLRESANSACCIDMVIYYASSGKLTFSCLKKHSIFSSLNTRFDETSDWNTFGSFLSATRLPSRGSVTALWGREEEESKINWWSWKI